jgi:predicted NBD/HSP70 family sugar kinase
MNRPLRVPPPLDPAFRPAALVARDYADRARASGRAAPLALGVEREDGLLSRHETLVMPEPSPETLRHAERLLKFLLWARGGWRAYVCGPSAVTEHLRAAYAAGGARAFDASLMERVYGRPFEVLAVPSPDRIPPPRDRPAAIGGQLDGCRLGFDLGASDFKVAAVRDGQMVFSEEFPWSPVTQSDPEYHYRHLAAGLRKAAGRLPRVDAIGGSSAGVIVNSEIRVASLFRGVPEAEFGRVRGMFRRLAGEWGVPVEVANDGDVTALAGAMSLGIRGVLGIAMGSSEAAGYLDPEGRLPGWLSELAFAPVDDNPDAPADEWSGDRGVGATYFSQQAVGRLLPAAGIEAAADMPLPERLRKVQDLMAAGDPGALRIYETIGSYLGYALRRYADFYAFGHVLVLGRVLTGEGGNVIVARAREVIAAEFPDLAHMRLLVPDEKSRRVGQAAAAASLPVIRP